jgi:hypothetical protein
LDFTTEDLFLAVCGTTGKQILEGFQPHGIFLIDHADDSIGKDSPPNVVFRQDIVTTDHVVIAIVLDHNDQVLPINYDTAATLVFRNHPTDCRDPASFNTIWAENCASFDNLIRLALNYDELEHVQGCNDEQSLVSVVLNRHGQDLNDVAHQVLVNRFPWFLLRT